jgi:hypothetical protein
MEDELKVTLATKGAGKDNHKECKDRNMEEHKKGAPGLHEGYESTKNQGEAAVRDDDGPQHSVAATGRDDKGTKRKNEATGRDEEGTQHQPRLEAPRIRGGPTRWQIDLGLQIDEAAQKARSLENAAAAEAMSRAQSNLSVPPAATPKWLITSAKPPVRDDEGTAGPSGSSAAAAAAPSPDVSDAAAAAAEREALWQQALAEEYETMDNIDDNDIFEALPWPLECRNGGIFISRANLGEPFDMIDGEGMQHSVEATGRDDKENKHQNGATGSDDDGTQHQARYMAPRTPPRGPTR